MMPLSWKIEFSTRPGNYAANYYFGRTQRSFETKGDYIYAAGATRDASMIACGGETGAVRLYEAKGGELLKEFTPAGN